MMFEAARSFETLSDLARALSAGHDPGRPFERLAHQIATADGVAAAGIAVYEADVLRCVASSDARLAELDALQEKQHTGPGADAARGGRLVTVDRIAEHEHRWPEYARLAARLGVPAAAALPLHAGGSRLGAITLYRFTGGWLQADLLPLIALADLAANLLDSTARVRRQDEVIGQLQGALESRIVIEQAKGMIAAKRSVPVDEAFRVLRKHARDRNASLQVVASAVVKLGLIP